MKLSELHRIVNLYYDADKPHRDQDVMIAIKLPFKTVGAIPMTPVKTASLGFDWEAGKFIIHPEENLSPYDEDFAKKFKDLQDKYGWLNYENRNLKAEIKKLKGNKP